MKDSGALKEGGEKQKEKWTIAVRKKAARLWERENRKRKRLFIGTAALSVPSLSRVGNDQTLQYGRKKVVGSR